MFVSPTNLHCSQTRVGTAGRAGSLFPLRIYTALKRPVEDGDQRLGLFPLRIYTALKLMVQRQAGY